MFSSTRSSPSAAVHSTSDVRRRQGGTCAPAVESSSDDPRRECAPRWRPCSSPLSASRLAAAPQPAALLPKGKKVFFGVSDTGDPADFGQFSDGARQAPGGDRVLPHLGRDFPESIERWQTARARPMIHITTADNNDGHELISPRAIAQGDGDEYLVRLNRLFWEKKMRAYIRPLGEPNRCLNVYAAYDCAGNAARRRPQAALVPARLPPHLRDRPRRRQGGADQRPPRRSRAAAAERRRRRPAEGAGRGRLEPAARRLADRPPEPAAATSTPATTGSTGSAPTSTPPNQEWKALDRPLQPLLRTSPSRSPSGASRSGDDPGFVRQPDDLGRAPPALQDARLLPGLRLDQLLPDPELPGQPRGAQRRASTTPVFPAFAPGPPQRAAAARRAAIAPEAPSRASSASRPLCGLRRSSGRRSPARRRVCTCRAAAR